MPKPRQARHHCKLLGSAAPRRAAPHPGHGTRNCADDAHKVADPEAGEQRAVRVLGAEIAAERNQQRRDELGDGLPDARVRLRASEPRCFRAQQDENCLRQCCAARCADCASPDSDLNPKRRSGASASVGHTCVAQLFVFFVATRQEGADWVWAHFAVHGEQSPHEKNNGLCHGVGQVRASVACSPRITNGRNATNSRLSRWALCDSRERTISPIRMEMLRTRFVSLACA